MKRLNLRYVLRLRLSSCFRASRSLRSGYRYYCSRSDSMIERIDRSLFREVRARTRHRCSLNCQNVTGIGSLRSNWTILYRRNVSFGFSVFVKVAWKDFDKIGNGAQVSLRPKRKDARVRCAARREIIIIIVFFFFVSFRRAYVLAANLEWNYRGDRRRERSVFFGCTLRSKGRAKSGKIQDARESYRKLKAVKLSKATYDIV